MSRQPVYMSAKYAPEWAPCGLVATPYLGAGVCSQLFLSATLL